jgi:hypothetical protein
VAVLRGCGDSTHPYCSLSRVCPLLLVLTDAVVPHHIEDRGRAERAAHEEDGGGGHEQRQLKREQQVVK